MQKKVKRKFNFRKFLFFIIFLFLLYMGISYLISVKTKNIDKEKIITAVVGIIIVLIIIKIAVGAGGNHHSKWSELSKEEQDNARWAYQVQEEIKNRQ